MDIEKFRISKNLIPYKIIDEFVKFNPSNTALSYIGLNDLVIFIQDHRNLLMKSLGENPYGDCEIHFIFPIDSNGNIDFDPVNEKTLTNMYNDYYQYFLYDIIYYTAPRIDESDNRMVKLFDKSVYSYNPTDYHKIVVIESSLRLIPLFEVKACTMLDTNVLIDKIIGSGMIEYDETNHLKYFIDYIDRNIIYEYIDDDGVLKIDYASLNCSYMVIGVRVLQSVMKYLDINYIEIGKCYSKGIQLERLQTIDMSNLNTLSIRSITNLNIVDIITVWTLPYQFSLGYDLVVRYFKYKDKTYGQVTIEGTSEKYDKDEVHKFRLPHADNQVLHV